MANGSPVPNEGATRLARKTVNGASMAIIHDAGFAAEAADLAKNKTLSQSSSAMLAQANSLSQNVLSLIR